MATPFPEAVIQLEGGKLALAGSGSPFNGKPGEIRFKSLLSVHHQGGAVRQESDPTRGATLTALVEIPPMRPKSRTSASSCP